MARYDWGWGGGYDRAYRARRGGGPGWGGWDDAWGGRPSSGFRGRGVGLHRNWGEPPRARGYDRPVYGGEHPGYGGFPGGRDRGMHYGGHGAGYDAGYAREAFIPEQAYRRHPELDRPQRQPGGRWPDRGHDLDRAAELDDREVRRAVRQNLYSDEWLEPDRIQVEVEDGVVTLTGEVRDYIEARYAWDDAWESPGVRGVINHLTVRAEPSREPHGDVLPQSE